MDYHKSDTSAVLPVLEQRTYFKEVTNAVKISHQHQENVFVDFKLQPTLPHMHSRNGPGLAVADINNDGLQDFYVGGATGYPGTFLFAGP